MAFVFLFLTCLLFHYWAEKRLAIVTKMFIHASHPWISDGTFEKNIAVPHTVHSSMGLHSLMVHTLAYSVTSFLEINQNWSKKQTLWTREKVHSGLFCSKMDKRDQCASPSRTEPLANKDQITQKCNSLSVHLPKFCIFKSKQMVVLKEYSHANVVSLSFRDQICRSLLDMMSFICISLRRPWWL